MGTNTFSIFPRNTLLALGHVSCNDSNYDHTLDPLYRINSVNTYEFQSSHKGGSEVGE